jgi:periplasmic divalent cation tolerance protein
MYSWKGKILDNKEIVLLLKCNPNNKGKILSEIKKLHSYEIPAIISFNVNINQEFLDFMLLEGEN